MKIQQKIIEILKKSSMTKRQISDITRENFYSIDYAMRKLAENQIIVRKNHLYSLQDDDFDDCDADKFFSQREFVFEIPERDCMMSALYEGRGIAKW